MIFTDFFADVMGKRLTKDAGNTNQITPNIFLPPLPQVLATPVQDNRWWSEFCIWSTSKEWFKDIFIHSGSRSSLYVDFNSYSKAANMDNYWITHYTTIQHIVFNSAHETGRSSFITSYNSQQKTRLSRKWWLLCSKGLTRFHNIRPYLHLPLVFLLLVTVFWGHVESLFCLLPWLIPAVLKLRVTEQILVAKPHEQGKWYHKNQ